ncbi:HNH endonuclease [Kaistella rhinocerotis]|uniref:HNH endonuclease n=1 Tax=Kaistella rhinocerotis TaxID=3026437 RepID=UPI0025540631|nr:HNH endonuclease [Kaistella sp. Ran72]
MKINTIKNFLKPYSIFENRKTTINHAFANGLARNGIYDEGDVKQALKLLGQVPSRILCVYCNKKAETWDHLQALVMKGEYGGFGNVLGNLVPACKKCNSAKGNKDWRKFVKGLAIDDESKLKITDQLEQYVDHYKISPSNFSDSVIAGNLKNLDRIKKEIFRLMQEADEEIVKIKKALE